MRTGENDTLGIARDQASKLVSAILKDKCDFLCHNFKFTSYKSCFILRQKKLLYVKACLQIAARLTIVMKCCKEKRVRKATSGGSTAGLRITVVANPQGTIAPLALRNQLSCQWNVLGPLKGAYQQYPWCSSRRPDVDRCIGG